MNSLKSRIDIENKEDNVYFNINLINNNSFSVPCQFSETLGADIVGDSSQYYLSIIRFSIDGASMPIFFFKDFDPLVPSSGYWVTLSYNGTDYSTPVVFNSIFTPTATTPPYNRSIYFYNAFIYMINTAFSFIFSSNPGVFPIGSVPPYLEYDPTNGIISLYAQSAYYDITLSTPITIFMNARLFNFFDNFISSFYGEGLLNYKDQQILVINLNGSNPGPTGYYKMSQEYQALYHWWDVSLLTFKSTMIGVRPEYVPIANQSTTLNNTGSAGTGIPFQTIMTDFIPDVSSNDPAGFRQDLVYTPSTQYRLIDIVNINTRTVDLIISFKDKQYNEYPFFIQPGKGVTVKMIFAKKSLYKSGTK